MKSQSKSRIIRPLSSHESNPFHALNKSLPVKATPKTYFQTNTYQYQSEASNPEFYFNEKKKGKIVKSIIDRYFGNLKDMRMERKEHGVLFGHKNIEVSRNLDFSMMNFTNTIHNTIHFKPKQQEKCENDNLANFKTKFYSYRRSLEKSNTHNVETDNKKDSRTTRAFSTNGSFRRNKMTIRINEAESKRRMQSDGSDNKEDIYLSPACSNKESPEKSTVICKTTSAFTRTSFENPKKPSKESNYYLIKHHKEFAIKTFQPAGIFLLNREIKLKNFGAKVLWSKHPLSNEFIMEAHQPLVCEFYYKVGRSYGDEHLEMIYLQEYTYFELFKNKNEWLRDIITCIAKQLIDYKNKIIINKITLNNICRLKEKEIRIIDWSGASLKEELTNLDKVKLVAITDPALQELPEPEELNIIKWICSPEYLAPEIVSGLDTGSFDQKLIWENSSGSDVWSLGCLIVEILTLIPLDANCRYSIKGRNLCRKGLLNCTLFSYGELLRKQKLFSTKAIRIIRKECQEIMHLIEPKVLEVMERMLAFNKKDRISAEEIIKILG